jgi:hypothetical protein
LYEITPEGVRKTMANIFQQTETEVSKSPGRGFNVKHITRVTGYFSYVENWNPAKRQELKDRHRTDGKEINHFAWYKGGSSED